MKLYYFPLSPYSQKALIALEEKGAKYDTEIIDVGDAAVRAEYVKVNRLGKVPFLLDEARDWKVPESSIIIEYVDRHCPGGTALIPSDPELSRQARFHDRLFDLYVTEQALKLFFDSRRPEDKRDPLGVEMAQKRLDNVYGLLDEILAKKNKWILGDDFSIGDVAAAPALAIARMMRPFDAHKNVVAYLGRLSERPSVHKAFKQAQEFMARR
ncbi:MAG: glutathione S-transferase [bacterium]|nr:glutathione S-transferase [bacterium]